MRVIYRDAVQVHAVPSQVLEATGPFAPQPQIIPLDQEYDPDEWPVPGATAQNGMRGVKYFTCNYCGDVLREDALDDHICEETE